MIKVAFGSVPKDGGTFTFYRNMRPALLALGVDLRCVSIGRDQAELWESAYEDDGCVLLAEDTRNLKKQSQRFAEWCEEEQIDIVMGINSQAILSALPHLPQRVRCISRCANSFDHGYRITMSGRERLMAIVAQTPRQQHDLVHHYGADPALIHLIPNGIDTAPFAAARESRRQINDQNEPLRLGFVGRLEHKQKGVLFIPEIVDELNRIGVEFTLRIAGKGRHRREMERRMKPSIECGHVSFIGAIPPPSIPAFLADVDVLLFPSQFEGCPNALIEAMMAGCAPVSWKLDGITDFIISDGQAGFLYKLGDCAAVAHGIEKLSSSRGLLRQLQANASSETDERFNQVRAASAYAKLFFDLADSQPKRWNPRRWKHFQGDANFPPAWRSAISKATLVSTAKRIIGK